jgi:transcriptional regulator with XRE-family HTH domain
MTHPVDIHVGHRLRHLRVLRGMTQTDVAQGLDISFQQVQKYELGRNRISASKIFDIAKILNVPPAYFFEGLGETGGSGPVIDDDTARIAATVSKIKDERVKSRLMAFIDAVTNSPHASQAQNALATEVAA